MTTNKILRRGTSFVNVSAGIPAQPGDCLFAQTVAEAHVADLGVPAWQTGVALSLNAVRRYDGRLWRCVQAHTSQADWLPGVAWALWAETWPSGVIPVWTQPQGAHDAYPAGFQVSHNGNLWTSDINANGDEPGVSSWTCDDCPETDAWAVGVAYAVNDEVTYQGSTYRCLQAHTSIVTWYPTAVGIINVLWVAI